MDSLILTNTVPMKAGFDRDVDGMSGAWQGLLQYIRDWVETYETVHVISGPVFDYNADGKRDHSITR